MLENFFRRWYLYLLPVVLLGLFGVHIVMGAKSAFVSSGTFNVEASTLISSLSGSGDQSFGYDTPAGATSKRISANLQTDEYVRDIATRAGLGDAIASGRITLAAVRASIATYANGNNLVTVSAGNIDPTVAQKLVAATIAAYVQSEIDASASQSTAAVAFFTNLLGTYKADLDNANAALDSYLTAHPAGPQGARGADQQTEIVRLTGDVTQAQNKYNDTLNKRQDAELSNEQTKADVGQRLRIVDQPQVPLAPTSGKKKKIMTAGTFLMLGVVLSVGALVLATVLDHTLRTPRDVETRLGIRLLGEVPDAKVRREKRRAGKSVAPRPVKAPKPAKTNTKPARTRGQSPRPAAVQPLPGRAARTGSRTRPAAARTLGKAGASGWPG
jgi:hypothetical protein